MSLEYYRSFLQLENQCNEYMRKANAEFEINKQHTKQEAIYLQQAALCRQQMASISTGAEKMHQREMIRELDERIQEIHDFLHPNTGKEEGSTGGNAGNGGNSSDKKDDIPADVASWYKEKPDHDFSSVAGMDDLKAQLKECLEDTTLGDLKAFFGIKQLKSYLFLGPPGCGKTFIIEAFAAELMNQGYKFLSLTSGDILSKYVGDAEHIVQRLFDEAMKEKCIVFIDEIDGVCRDRNDPNLPHYASSITTAFLTGYNKIHSKDSPIVFIAATNYPNRVDTAMLDRVELIYVPLPDAKARASALKRNMGNVKDSAELTYEQMGAEMKDYNYRDILRLSARLKSAMIKDVMRKYGDQHKAIEALSSGEYCLTKDMFENIRSKCLPNPKDTILKELEEWMKKFEDGTVDEKSGKPASDSFTDDRW